MQEKKERRFLLMPRIEFQNGNCWYTPGSFRKSGKQKGYRIRKMKECGSD